MSRLRHSLILLLCILLPLHAFLVTVGTKVVAGSGHSPLTALAIWKEGLVGILLVLVFVEVFLSEKKVIARIMGGGVKWKWSLDSVTWCVLSLVVLAFAVKFWTDVPDMQWAFGFKYLIFPLILFLMLSQVEWDEGFLAKRLIPAILVVGGVVALYGIITFFLPQGFFSWLGYSDAHSLYAPNSSLSAFQQISGTGIRRIQSTLAGPNQLGIWLLLPWGIVVSSLVTGHWPLAIRSIKFAVIVLIAIAIFLTFSRSAWIAAFIITIIAIAKQLKGRVRIVTLSSIVGFVIVSLVVVYAAAPQLIQRSISNKHHFERTRDGVVAMFAAPLGHGLGTAGPASNRFSDPCLHFEEGADISWASDRDDLCLFVDNEQVQPVDRECNCPVLPENWYVQVGYELGLIGFVIFITLIVFVIRKLLIVNCSLFIPLVFIGISIASIFLHAWEDSAVAYTVWSLVGIILSRKQ